jgi:hypothetical protein
MTHTGHTAKRVAAAREKAAKDATAGVKYLEKRATATKSAPTAGQNTTGQWDNWRNMPTPGGGRAR